MEYESPTEFNESWWKFCDSESVTPWIRPLAELEGEHKV